MNHDLPTIKKRITEVRKSLKEARENNRTLYAQLRANRTIKSTLNASYAELRALKKTLRGPLCQKTAPQAAEYSSKPGNSANTDTNTPTTAHKPPTTPDNSP